MDACGWLGWLLVSTSVFSPGVSGPTTPESLGPASHVACPCVDAHSSSTWPHPSQILEPTTNVRVADRRRPEPSLDVSAAPITAPSSGAGDQEFDGKPAEGRRGSYRTASRALRWAHRDAA